MSRPLVFAIFSISLSVLPGRAEEQGMRALMPQQHLSVLKRYCFDCHDAESHEGNVDLQSLSFELNTLPTAEQWQKVLNAVNEGEMPPRDSDQLSDDEKADFLGDLSRQLVVARKILSDSGGAIVMRRLNRREYANTIRDLLGVTVDVSLLPDDFSSGGFDTSGSALFFSSDQLEKYLSIGRAAIDEALDPRWVDRSISRTRTQPETSLRKNYQQQVKTRTNELRRVKLRRQHPDQPASDFGFIDDDRLELEESRATRVLPILNAYLNHPLSKSGALLGIVDRKLTAINTSIPSNAPAGRYTIRIRVGGFFDDVVPPHMRDLELLRKKPGSESDWELVGTQRVTAQPDDPQILAFTVDAPAKIGRTFRIRSRQPGNSKASVDWARSFVIEKRRAAIKTLPGDERKAALRNVAAVTVPFLWVDWVEIEGPSNDVPPVFRTRFGFPSTGDTLPRRDARETLKRFANVVFRGKPPTETLIDRLMAIIETKEPTSGFDDSLRTAMSVILASPKFLYIIEPSENGARRQLSDVELANRLSYFLWSAPPDETLLRLASEQQLSKPSILRQQTERLLSDHRSDAFIESFVHQWLDLERLDFFQFSVRRFPTFDESLRSSARQEIVETFADLIRNRRSIRELLHSDHVVINDVLARHYDIEGVDGPQFRRVAVPADNPRGGLLATAAVLAMGSDGERSSPVERGAWVLRHLLNDSPPPAPANVPQLNRNENPHQPARLIQKSHQNAPQCAQCHRTIDPIGYGLENFAADGRWREKEITEKAGARNKIVSTKAFPIDASGTLPNGVAFQDFYEMRAAIAEQDDELARCLTEALIAYGLGRPFGFTDQPLADSIITDARTTDFTLNTFLHSLIQSEPFRTK